MIRMATASTEPADHLEIFDKFSGKLVGVDDDVEVVEGNWPFTRTVLIEFPARSARGPGMSPTNIRQSSGFATAPRRRTW